jgi:hypothetical protein
MGRPIHATEIVKRLLAGVQTEYVQKWLHLIKKPFEPVIHYLLEYVGWWLLGHVLPLNQKLRIGTEAQREREQPVYPMVYRIFSPLP